MKSKLSARANVDVGQDVARQWFLDLETHPERYQFATHAGFEFVKGNFGEIGAKFQTEERFLGLKATLRFALTELETYQFHFQLLRPSLPIWGTFSLERISDHQTAVHLQIGSERSLGRFFLNLPPISTAIRRQIQREVDHIKMSMETVSSSQAASS
jgi:hypothetical protein